MQKSKLFFGNETIYIDTKAKIEAKSLGATIPDGFLFDLFNLEDPEFYLVEIELSSHDFHGHIFPQITRFIAFFKNSASRAKLARRIFALVTNDRLLKEEFKKRLGDQEIYKFINDIIENSQNILLVIDGEKQEIPEILDTYHETWGKMVKVMIVKKFMNSSDVIYTLNPDFRDIEYPIIGSGGEDREYTEEYHLDGASSEIKELYLQIKAELLGSNRDLKFNPQKYYISIIQDRNIAYFRFTKKKIKLVVKLPEEEVRARIKEHAIVHLSEGVQRFWGGPSCELVIDSKEKIGEIIELLKAMTSTPPP